MPKFREIYAHNGQKQCVPACVVRITSILFKLSRRSDSTEANLLVKIIRRIIYSFR